MGEVEALSLMSFEPGAVFLTDDAAARIVAAKLGYRVHGTIGVLIRAIRRNLLKPEEVADALNRIHDVSTLYIKKTLLQEIISKVLQKNG
jgi:predicted nucleic acid-binding protein